MNREFLESVSKYLDSCHRYNLQSRLESTIKRESEQARYDLNEINSGELTYSSGLCRESSFLLKSKLKEAFNQDWSIAGGYALKKGLNGMDMVKQEYHQKIAQSTEKPFEMFGGQIIIDSKFNVYGSHWWLERGEEIIDLTADQYGHEKIIISDSNDKRYIKVDSMSGLDSIKEIRNKALMWSKNLFQRENKNSETENVISAYKILQNKISNIKNENSYSI